MLASDLAGIGLLAASLRRLGRVPSRIAAGVASRIAVLIEEEFEFGADPYGNAWAPLRPTTLDKHGPPPLTDTRDLRDSLAVKAARGAGVQITMRDYAAFHQGGFRNGEKQVPARPVLPATAFPARWSEVVRAETYDAFTEVLK